MKLGIQLIEKNGMFYFKNTSLSKAEKERAKAGILEKLTDIGEKYKSETLPLGEAREWIYFCPKIGGKRTPISFYWQPGELSIALFSKLTAMVLADPKHKTKGWGVLKVGDKEYPLSSQGVIEVFKLPIQKMTASGYHQEHVNMCSAFATSNKFWDGGKWKEGLYQGANSEAGLEYRGKIYPLFEVFAEQILPANSVILEVCAGDGELAERLFTKFPSKISKYHLLDLNKPSLEVAEKRLPEQKDRQTVFFHHVNVAEAEFLELTKCELVDCVLGSGALTAEVLPTRELALKALDQIAKVVRPGGVLMFAGLQRHWVHTKDLEDRGFVVTCKFCIQPVYLARKTQLMSAQ